ncbi:MAG: DUF885 family protein [Gammaproteobacteria bacterium]|nr:MAG: DUF885 family protein [Gammaproteobacteria bacterium]
MRQLGLRVALAALCLALVACSSSAQAEDPAFEAFIDRYLEEVRGVGATQAPSEMSAESFNRQLETKRRFLSELGEFNRSALSFDQDIDYRFLESILRADIHWEENVQRWRQDPETYMPTRSTIYTLTSDIRAPAERARDLIADLEILQVRLANGKQNVDEYIDRWVARTLENLDGFVLSLSTNLPEFAARLSQPLRGELEDENARALAALRDYRQFLTDELPTRPAGDWRVGEDVFNAQHELRYMFSEDDIHLRRIARGAPSFSRVPNYHDWGWKQFNIVRQHLEVKARQIDPTRTWLEIIHREKDDHFFNEQLVYEHHKILRRTRDWVIDNDLVTIPWDDDDHIMVAGDPSLWAAQWWGFAGTVPAGSPSRKSGWTVIPVNPDWPDYIAEGNLREKDPSFAYVIAPHEGYPGHHLQRLYANENPRRLRVYESSYSNQAWCYYIEWELTPDPQYGWFPEDKQDVYELEYLRAKLWRFGRVIIDSGLHTGRMSYDDAINLETNVIGFVPRGAQINIDGITAGGSRTSAPTLGYFEFMLLREDYFQKMRELDQRGELKDFHDRIYRIGWLPVSLIREALFHELEQEFGA